MQFLRRLEASKMNPLGPDIANAPWMTFNLSGTELRFRCPPHEMPDVNITIAPESLNIYQDDIYERWNRNEEMGMSIPLLLTGWDFRDRPFGEGSIGYVKFEVHLQRRHPHYRKIDSLFKPSDMKDWILRCCEGVWGGRNKRLWENRENYDSPIVPENDFWRYPQSANKIRKMAICGADTFGYIIDIPLGPKERVWNLAISDDHIIVLRFEPRPLNREYYEPDHDLDGAVEKKIQEFMSHVHVKLAPDAQQRYDEVMIEVNQTK
ncbi:hypothetical protein [Hahella ganghwensis]|uniref:hypothetical protein n=1 Tax=Hahella ganghwensis TaxID=286420 RepID=UPI00035E9943|nr:hypothetical protein [Hahella ganghwensis]